MKLAIITDQHFGARNDSLHFINFFEKFYDNAFFPTLEKEGIKTLLILGDTFDRRKYINFFSLKKTKEMFFDKLAAMDIKVHMLAGNHDTYFKNTNDVNSVDLLLREYSNVHIIDTPEEIWVGDEFDIERICMMPWICAENYEDSLKMIKDTSAQICMGHFEIQGFAMFRGMESHEGLSRDIFNKFDVVCSGHYHHKSSSGNIHYLGNPYELTWSDYDDPRGFHIFDTATREFDFIKNPYTIFHKISYDDTTPNAISDISNVDLSEHKDSYVKVIVVNKTNPYLFDLFMSNLYKQNPIDVSIVEDNLDLTEGLESDIISDAEDTLTILNKYVDNIQVQDLDGDRLKSVLKELYVEALNLETI